MILLAMAISDAILTTVVTPMEQVVLLNSFTIPSDMYCKVKVLLKSTWFNLSLLFIFTLSVARLVAGFRDVPIKFTYKMVAWLVAGQFVAAICLSFLYTLNPYSATFAVCKRYGSDNTVSMGTHALSTSTPLEQGPTSDGRPIPPTQYPLNDTQNIGLNNRPMPIYLAVVYIYMFISFTLFIGTVLSYLTLAARLRMKRGAGLLNSASQTSGRRDILTLRVTVIVTLCFVVSFLVPFFPVIIKNPLAPQFRFHYLAIFDSLANIQGAANPVIYFLSNRVYKRAVLAVLSKQLSKVGLCRSFRPTLATVEPIGLIRPTTGTGSAQQFGQHGPTPVYVSHI